MVLTLGETISRSAANNDLVKAKLYFIELENYHFEDDLLEAVNGSTVTILSLKARN